MLVGARGMGVGDERRLHHGEDEAEDEDEEQHNDAAGLPAAISPATAAYFVGPGRAAQTRIATERLFPQLLARLA